MANYDGVARKGKTEGKQLGIDGEKVMGNKGGKGKKGISNQDLRTMGRNLAKIANQKG